MGSQSIVPFEKFDIPDNLTGKFYLPRKLLQQKEDVFLHGFENIERSPS